MEFVRIDSLFAAVFLWHPSLIEFVMIYCERSVRKIVGNTGRRLWADQKKNVSGAQHAETERETGHKNKGCRLVAPVSACEKQRTINGCRLRRNSLVLFFFILVRCFHCISSKNNNNNWNIWYTISWYWIEFGVKENPHVCVCDSMIYCVVGSLRNWRPCNLLRSMSHN